MSGEAEDRLYGLMEIAERQQVAVQAALDGLAAERAALKREREMLARGVGALGDGMRMAVQSAITESLAAAATQGVEAVQMATRPLLGKLAGVTESTGRAEAALREVVLWASWRLLGWIVAVVAALVLLGWLASSAVLWWDISAIGAAQVKKAQLQVDVAALQASHDSWVQAGMLGKLEWCGPNRRPCIRVNESAGAFESDGHADYRIIQGY
jgi:hypothetical protein